MALFGGFYGSSKGCYYNLLDFYLFFKEVLKEKATRDKVINLYNEQKQNVIKSQQLFIEYRLEFTNR